MDFIRGQAVEIGFGEVDTEFDEIIYAWSKYISIDVDLVSQKDIENIFGSEGDIMYIGSVVEESQVKIAKEVYISSFL